MGRGQQGEPCVPDVRAPRRRHSRRRDAGASRAARSISEQAKSTAGGRRHARSGRMRAASETGEILYAREGIGSARAPLRGQIEIAARRPLVARAVTQVLPVRSEYPSDSSLSSVGYRARVRPVASMMSNPNRLPSAMACRTATGPNEGRRLGHGSMSTTNLCWQAR